LVHFSDLVDPRVERTKLHPLLLVVAIALGGVICGADSWVEVAECGEARRDWLAEWLDRSAGIPWHDPCGRVFAARDPVGFETCFAGGVGAVAEATDGQVVALDGQVSRGSHDRLAGRTALDLVRAWACTNRLVLAHVAVAAGSNEIPAMPALLQLLVLKGCISTIDAIGCQTAIAQAIRAQGADYVLALKANQETLYQAVVAAFAERRADADLPYRHNTHREVDKGPGRVEVRTSTVIDDPDLLTWRNPDHAWDGLTGVACLEAERRLGGASSRETRYYLTSLTTARLVHHAVRSHWGIENSVHWVLDLAFREDLSRVRIGHGAHHFSVLRRRSLNLLRQDRTARCGIKGRRLKAALNPAYLLATLNGSR
jgi:predicted transposase YbfD/YdcC